MGNSESEMAPVLKKGVLLSGNREKWKKIVSQKQFGITLDLHLGNGTFRLLTTDLSENYVDFSKRD